MDIQTYLKNEMEKNRNKKLRESDQLTLGELIKKIEAIVRSRVNNDDDLKVYFDFEYLFPVEFISWRGIYSELSLTFSEYVYGDHPVTPMTATEFLDLCRTTIGKVFEGYKGGEYRMSESTPIWIAKYGNSGSTALIDVACDNYNIILITGYREAY